jgi:hypothetical protein
LDAEMVGWLGVPEKAKQMLDGEADRRSIAELLLIGGVIHPEILQLALPHIDRSREDSWWAGKLDEACGRGDLVCLRMLLERCDVASAHRPFCTESRATRGPHRKGSIPKKDE